ncbi:MAG: cyclic pyranopterin monophosphate synthase MoaC, partial [Clostridia bacterium]|nr:cyclic pyranopterin monophosphate synthase MoaC [Clostridia bacterium]
SEKPESRRTAVAAGRVLVNASTFNMIKSGGVKKGDVLAVAQVAGIMAAKHTHELIPMCHPILIDGVELSLRLDEGRHSVEIEARITCEGRTGVEMEALTAVSVAALTVYDMCKAVQRDMVISDIRLASKTGGVHGDYRGKDEGYV